MSDSPSLDFQSADDLLKADFFTLFSLPKSYELDGKQLKQRFQALQSKFHPDRFVSKSSAEQRMAVQFAARINQGWETLSDDVARARYCLELVGHDIPLEQTTQDVEFLMQQMELREELELAKSESELESVEQHAVQALLAFRQEFSTALSAQDFVEAEKLFRRMQFLAKLKSEAEQALDALLDAL